MKALILGKRPLSDLSRASLQALGHQPPGLWVDCDDREVQDLKEVFGLHDLALEDCRNQNQRPKVDGYGDHYFLVFNRVTTDGKKDSILPQEVDIFIGQHFLITVHRQVIPELDQIWATAGEAARGVDFLLYKLVDTLVDGYFPILDKLEDELERLEEAILSAPGLGHMEQLFRLKHQGLVLRKILGPQRDLLFTLTRRDLSFITGESQRYFADVYDHALRIHESGEFFREMVGHTLEAYLSVVSNRTNDIMKALTAISIIFMPLTLLAGIYGMNFRYMPELEWRFGYLAVWLVMVVIGGGLFVYFRRREWL